MNPLLTSFALQCHSYKKDHLANNLHEEQKQSFLNKKELETALELNSKSESLLNLPKDEEEKMRLS